MRECCEPNLISMQKLFTFPGCAGGFSFPILLDLGGSVLIAQALSVAVISVGLLVSLLSSVCSVSCRFSAPAEIGSCSVLLVGQRWFMGNGTCSSRELSFCFWLVCAGLNVTRACAVITKSSEL
jgi:hypothetical protein